MISARESRSPHKLMIRWESLTDEKARQVWDQALTRFSDCSPFQSYAWGEYRRGLGWETHRWVALNDQNEIVAMMQGYVRRHRFGFGMLWSEGGPVGDLSVCDESLQAVIKRTVGLKRLYCRFRCDRARKTEDVLVLNSKGWSFPWAPLNSNLSMILDLTKDGDALLAGCARKWRGKLRRVGENNETVRPWLDPNADEILSVYESMQKAKGLGEQQSRKEIEQLLENLGPQLVLYRCDDEHGRIVSLGGALVIGGYANLWLMATTEEGRKLNAAFGVFWALVQQCRKMGVHSYDLGGIDPVRNHGVYRFKKDSGAAPIELLGEWDWASRPWLRWIGNWAIAQRSRLRRAENAFNNARTVVPSPRVANAAPEALGHAGKEPAAVRAN